MIVYAILIVAALCCLLGAVSASVTLQSTITEIPSATQLPFGQSGASIISSGLNKTTSYTASTTQNTTVVGYGTITLSAGAAALNLAAIPGLNGVAQDFTGLKIRSIHLRAGAVNANPITMSKGASNGYTGAGAAFSVTLVAGKEALIETDTTAVAAGVRTLDVAGTGAQTLDYIITAGNN